MTLPETLRNASQDAFVYNGPIADSLSSTLSLFTNEVRSFNFAPQYSELYTFKAHETDLALDPELAIYSATTGALIARNRDKSFADDDAELSINLTQDVLYIVAVADEFGQGGNIEFTITGSLITPSSAIKIDGFGDATLSVSLEVPTDIDYFEFTAPREATGSLRLITSGIQATVGLFDLTGRLLFNGSGRSGSIPITAGKTYRLSVFPTRFNLAGRGSVQIDFEVPGMPVTNTLDAGPGSLRQAILESNASANVEPDARKIYFAIPGAGPHTIALASALPDITKPVRIDATVSATPNVPGVAIDGSALTGTADGLRILASDVTIERLSIHSFPGDGIEVLGQQTTLFLNYIGTDLTGLISRPNRRNGILIQNSSSNILNFNVVSGNGLSGVAIVGENADSNRILGNTIGAQANGTGALPNANHGILITDADSNNVERNVISGNRLNGVVINGTAVTNTLARNMIGTSGDGLTALPNEGDGVVITSPRNKVGTVPAGRNIIAGNGKTGITLSGSGASSNVIEANYIGTDSTGKVSLPNGSDGIRVNNAPRNRIGSATDATAGNLISGNRGSGISFTNAGSTGNLVVGNLIGTAADGLAALGNFGSGVLLSSGATNVQIGLTNAISRNVIAANGSGIFLSSTAQGNRISRNLIGVNTAGAPRGNSFAGISVQGANNTIGGENATFGNTIAGNPIGIILSGVNATNNSIASNIIGTEAAAFSGNGIQFANSASTNTIGPRNSIRRNLTGIRIADGSREIRITQNTTALNLNLGIDLLPTVGTNENDAGDADNGANQLQNSPTLTADPILIGTDVELSFLVSSSPLRSAYPLTIEIYASDGENEGAKYLGTTLYTESNFSAGVKTVSFAGAGLGLTAGISRIVGLASDLRGNTSEYSRQRNLVSGAARNVLATTQNANALDVNGDSRLSTADLGMLVDAIGSPQLPTELHPRDKSTMPKMELDINRNGVIELQDMLLVVRGIEMNKLNWRSVSALNTAIRANTWDQSLLELLSTTVRKCAFGWMSLPRTKVQ